MSGRGRPPVCSEAVRRRVVELRIEGLSLQGISDAMNEAGCPTPSGRKVWSRYTVHRLLWSKHVSEYMDKLDEASESHTDAMVGLPD
jgi:hypothetical protein